MDAPPEPDNLIARLTRWVDIDFDPNATNHVDAAIAAVTNDCQVVDDMKGRMTRPTSAQPAVGLLFAGGPFNTLVCPINAVVSQLGVEMTAGATARYQVTPADAMAPGLAVQKTGRTTEYTTGRIIAIDGRANIIYDQGDAYFEDCILTTVMDMGGDSGSVVCRGGSGAVSPFLLLPCPFLSVMQDLTGVPFTQEWMSITYARDKYLATTLVGRWLIDTLYLNEKTAMTRAGDVRPHVVDDDRAFAQALYSQYGGDMKLAMMDPDRTDIRISEQFLANAEESLARARKHMLPEEADASAQTIALVRQHGIVGRNGRELVTMLDDPELLRKLKEIAARSGSVKDPDD